LRFENQYLTDLFCILPGISEVGQLVQVTGKQDFYYFMPTSFIKKKDFCDQILFLIL